MSKQRHDIGVQKKKKNKLLELKREIARKSRSKPVVVLFKPPPVSKHSRYARTTRR